MTDDRLTRVEAIVHEALARPASERESFVREACGEDAALGEEVLSLLAHADVDAGFLEGRPGLPEAAATPLAAGTRLGRYEILAATGDPSGMGEVYRARDTRLPRTVAVKILPWHSRTNASLLARFKREADAIGALNHPHICTLHDVDRHEDIDFLVMEYIDGETLRGRLRRGPLPVEETIRYARQVADALAAAHRLGLAHRDIKPANIMITRGGPVEHVKVVDFGLATLSSRFVDQDSRGDETTEPGGIVGTPYYMSPEQARGLPLDQRTDIFSLGVVIFECLSGRLPFDGETRDDYLRQLLYGEPHSLTELRPDLPADLRALVARCLERDPVKRLDSASWLSTELQRIVDGRSTSGRVESAPVPAPRPLARYFWIGAAGTAAVVAIVAVWLSSDGNPSSPDTQNAQLRRFTTSAGVESDSRLSPHGKWISFVSFARGTRQLVVQEIDGTVPQPVKLPPGTLQNCVWSPDQSRYACLILQLNDEWALQIVRAPEGGETPENSWVLRNITRGASLLRWIEDAIYLQVEKTGVRSQSLQRFYPARGGEAEPLRGPWDTMSVRGFDVRPDGPPQVVWAATGGPDWDDLWLANLDGGSPARLTDGDDRSRKRFPLWKSAGSTVIYQTNRGGQTDLWEIDTTVRTPRPLTSDPGIEVPESSSRDGSVSFQLTSEEAALWIWPRTAGAGRQVSDGSLSDFAPTVSSDSTIVAFQRSLPSPLEGFLTMDSDLFWARLASPPARLVPAKVDTGQAPALSTDGRFVAYLQRVTDSPGHRRLLVTEIEASKTSVLSTTLLPPSNTPISASWTEHNLAWSASGDLYYSDRADAPNRFRLVRWRPGRNPEPLRTTESASRIADLYASPDGRTVAYLTHPSEIGATKTPYRLYAFDVASGRSQVLSASSGEDRVFFRGWTHDGAELVLTRDISTNAADQTLRVAVVVLGRDGSLRKQHTIDRVWQSGTARLIGLHSKLYFTRSVDGIANLNALSLSDGRVRQVSNNAVLDVTFGAVEPLGSDRVLGVELKKTADIHLFDARPRTDTKHAAPGR